MFGSRPGGDGAPGNVFGSSKFSGGGGSNNSAGNASHKLTPDIQNQIITTVKQDMDSWEKSGQWTFSCYSCFKDCESVPGLPDYSPEELRLEAYESLKAGNTNYQTKVTQLTQEYRNKRSLLANPDQQLRQVLFNIYLKQPLGDYVLGSGQSSIFSSGGTGLFGGGGSSSNTGLFGGSSGSGTSQSLFGGNSSQPASGSSIFGGSSVQGGSGGSSIFGGSQGASSTFGQSSAFGSGTTSGGGGIFGGGSSASGGGIFGGGQGGSSSSGGIFGGGSQAAVTPAGGGLFSQPAATSSGGIFGTAPAQPSGGAGFFSQPTTTPQSNPPQGLFGGGSSASTSAPSTGLFSSGSAAAVASSPFGGGTTQAASAPFGGGVGDSGGLFSQPATDLFDKSATAGSGLFGAVEASLDPSCVYSTLEELSQADIEAFKSEAFQEGRVPVRPPAQEFCAPI